MRCTIRIPPPNLDDRIVLGPRSVLTLNYETGDSPFPVHEKLDHLFEKNIRGSLLGLVLYTHDTIEGVISGQKYRMSLYGKRISDIWKSFEDTTFASIITNVPNTGVLNTQIALSDNGPYEECALIKEVVTLLGDELHEDDRESIFAGADEIRQIRLREQYAQGELNIDSLELLQRVDNNHYR